MRIVPFIISTVLAAALVFALDNKWGSVPPLGKFLSPQQGFWQNAEATDHDFSADLAFSQLQGRAQVYLDNRLVPHVFSDNEEDAYFVQGFLHARFRLWQMDFNTRAAAGRISEVLGNDPRFIRYDRLQRRIGMVYAAENAVKAMEADPLSKKVIDAYTAGVNAYINSLTQSSLPIEYKLLDYCPEPWSNLKIALFIKLMSADLAGLAYSDDIERTNEKAVFTHAQMRILYPQISDSSIPIVPKGTPFAPPSVVPVKPATADSLYFEKDTTVNPVRTIDPVKLNGSNNWAVSGQKTRSGAPILCNDPHLGLTFPSIWFEMQLTTPQMNAYGVSFPGVPGVVIGFNDSIAFGFTNAGRDVGEYYQVRFKDLLKKEYWFNGKWEPTKQRIEQIFVRDGAVVEDTVAYTVFGPVMYDPSFVADDSATTHNALAFRWLAHDPSNEVMTWIKLDRAKNYSDYLSAIKHFSCPGQNMLYASKKGTIAIWQQGKFPALWEGQGQYIMPGEDSSYMWQGFIPQEENPHVINPPSGFVQSANQRPVDSAYPYFIPGNYYTARSISLAKQLQQMQQVTVRDMMRLQNDEYDAFAAMAVPLLLKNVDESKLNALEKEYLQTVASWNFYASAEAEAPTIFYTWWNSLDSAIWFDEFSRIRQRTVLPTHQTLVELLLRDSTMQFVDNVETPQVESLPQQVTAALKAASDWLQNDGKGDLAWWKIKNTSIYHLLRTAVQPFARTGLYTGGWRTTLNAQTGTHGPSWRMIVHLTPQTEAYGVYPGGQSGNPGSRFYDSFVNAWATASYYPLWVMKPEEATDKRVRWKMTFTKA